MKGKKLTFDYKVSEVGTSREPAAEPSRLSTAGGCRHCPRIVQLAFTAHRSNVLNL